MIGDGTYINVCKYDGPNSWYAIELPGPVSRGIMLSPDHDVHRIQGKTATVTIVCDPNARMTRQEAIGVAAMIVNGEARRGEVNLRE